MCVLEEPTGGGAGARVGGSVGSRKQPRFFRFLPFWRSRLVACRELARGPAVRSRGHRALARVSPDPVTFNEKVHYRMAFDRRPALARFADKVAIRDFVAGRLGRDYLTESYGVYQRGGDIDWARLPREFVVKASHGSGAVVVVWEGAERRPFPGPGWRARWDWSVAHPDEVAHEELGRLCDRWLRLRYEYGPGRMPEWAYRNVPPAILVEELLVSDDGRLPDDYKLFAFDGRCALIQVDSARFEDHRRDLFDCDWNLLPVRLRYANADVHAARPRNLDAMVAAAEELSRGMDFVRVDLYSVKNRVVVGELTNYPEAGTALFEPDEFNRTLGALWAIPAQLAPGWVPPEGGGALPGS